MAPKAQPEQIETPYVMGFRVKGTRGFLFSRPPDEMKPATKLPKIPTKRDHEAKVWRVNDGLAYPGAQLIRRLSQAGRGTPNPAPMGKGSAMGPIVQAVAVANDNDMLPFFGNNGNGNAAEPVLEWDDVLKHWVGAKHGGYTWRPYLEPGWELEFALSCAYPQWFSASELHKLVVVLGLIGIGDGTALGYGRFAVVQATPPEQIEHWI